MFLTELTAGDIFYPSADYQSALTSAQAHGKLLAVFIYDPVSPACNAMEQNSQNKKLAIYNILSDFYYPILVDISSAIGQEWKQDFEFTATPTLLFFDHDGILIKRTEQAMSSDQVIQCLDAVLFYSKNQKWPMETKGYTSVSNTALITPADGGIARSDRTVMSNANYKKSRSNPENSITTHRILIHSAVKGTPLKRIVEQLQDKFGNEEVSISSYWENEQQYLQVWLGRYDTRSKAEEVLQRVLRSGYPDAKVFKK